MAKVRAQTGASLADVYDVTGSSVQVDNTDFRDLKGVHEFGHTIFSERYSARMRLANSGAIAQSTPFVVTLDQSFDAAHHRIFNAFMSVDTAGRVADAAILMHDSFNSRESPILVFDGTNTDVIRFDILGSGAGAVNVLRPLPAYTLLPMTKVGDDRLDLAVTRWQYRVRGNTTAFGAGTVTITLGVMHGFATGAGGLSSRGLPVPSW